MHGPLANARTRIAEHAHPRSFVAPVLGMPGILTRHRNAFRMRHHDGDATIFIAKAANAIGRAVWIRGIAVGNIAVVIDVAQRNGVRRR